MENKKVISTRDQLLHLAKDVTSSIVGSAACVYSGQPFDTIKGKQQNLLNSRDVIIRYIYIYIYIACMYVCVFFLKKINVLQFECKCGQQSTPVPLSASRRPCPPKDSSPCGREACRHSLGSVQLLSN